LGFKKGPSVVNSNFSSSQTRNAFIDRLLDWHDHARSAGREARADALLVLACFAYDQPLVARATIDQRRNDPRLSPRPSSSRPYSQAILAAFPALAELSADADSPG
jgi:hypothetical protein